MYKEEGGAKIAHKGYNGRVIAIWLGDCMERAISHRISPDRDFGKWLDEHGGWPGLDDEMLAPTAVAMQLLLINFLFIVLRISERSFPLIQISWLTRPKYLRISLRKWFHAVETHGRYLLPALFRTKLVSN